MNYKFKAAVSKIEKIGNDTFYVTFSTLPRYTRFKAGQFLHLTLDEFDPTTGFWPESRVFSIASEPNISELAIVYSVKGKYTQRMKQELNVGKEIWLKLPFGDFIIENQIKENNTVVLIAGGTGVAPYLPFLKKTIQNPIPNPIMLFYGVRTENQLFGLDVMKEISSNSGFISKIWIEENKSTQYETGRLDINNILKHISDKENAVFFLSGPPAMIKQFKSDLLQNKVALESIKIDEWE